MGLVAVGASLGCVVGWAAGLEEVLQQGYLGLGFRRTAALELRAPATGAALLGALVAAIVALARELSPTLRRALSPDLPARAAREPLLRARLFAWIASGALVLLAIRALPGGSRRSFEIVLLVGTLAALRGLVGLLARVPEAALHVGTHAAFAYLAWRALGVDPAFLSDPLAGGNAISLGTAAGCAAALFAVAAASAAGARGGARAATLAPLLALALLWALSPLVLRPSLRAANPKNVLLIGVDTLRRDHTSLAGTGGRLASLTPELARFAREAVVFEGAISQSAWTLPAFASILTGRYAEEHGAFAFKGLLRESELTLGELLREAGYRTSAVVSHLLIDARHGFAQGFEHFDESNVQGEQAVTSGDVTDAAIEMLERGSGKPFFAFVHYFDPHYEYRDHADWSFSDAYDGWLRDPKQLDIGNLRAKRHELRPSDLSHLRALYDEDVAYTDREIGRLLAGLAELGLAEETAVVIVSDHGEEFLERGWLGHTVSLYDEVLRVPLLMRLPGVAPRNVEPAVETRAVFATLVDFLGLEGSAVAEDTSLLPLARGAQPAEPQPVFASIRLAGAHPSSGKRVELTAVRRGDWKLIRDHLRRHELLFNLRDDPSERRNRARDSAGALRELRAELLRWEQRVAASAGKAPERSLEPEEVERLKALGYL